jgi:hypothetical protein
MKKSPRKIFLKKRSFYEISEDETTEYIGGRYEIGGVYLLSQLECTLQLCTSA